MNITKNEFFFRLIAMTIIGAAAALIGVISSSWWAGGLFGLLFAMVFTLYDQRILAQKVFSKLGKEPFFWYFIHAVLGGIGYVTMLYAFGLIFSINPIGGWLFYTFATINYAILCERSLREFFYLLPMWLATRL
jgi:hypothetical protein